ncbi:MAG TPA: hypothetical protein GX528_01535 [Firmicutes bacterium]|nr:hypothetical protein [Bacillota bacterium]
MKQFKLGLLLLLALLFSQSLLPQAGLSELALPVGRGEIFAQQLREKEAAAYRRDLLSAGESLFSKRAAELELAYAQALKNETRALVKKAAEKAAAKQAELDRAALRNRLELALLDLSQKQREQKIKEEAAAREEYAAWLEAAEAETEAELNRLAEHYERALRHELAELKLDLEQTMAEDYARYKERRAEISALPPKLRSGP